jgi:hypothetical protein
LICVRSRMRRVVWILPVALILLTSCEPGLGKIGASLTSNGQDVTIEIARCPGDLVQDIRLLALLPGSPYNAQVLVWQIRSPGEPTDSVMVGSTPPGYEEVVGLLRPLGRSEELTAVVVAKGGMSSGLQSFQIGRLTTQMVYVGREFTDEAAWRDSATRTGCSGGSFLSGAWWMVIGFWGLILAIAGLVWLPRLGGGREPNAETLPPP